MTPVIVLNNLSISRENFDVWVDDGRVAVTYLEFELLFLLASQAGRVVSIEDICARLWGDGASNVSKLTVHVSRLRKKIAGSSWVIRTVKKRGYSLTEGVSIAPSAGR